MTNNKKQKTSTISLKNTKYFKLNIGTRVLVKDLHKNKKMKVFGSISLESNNVSKIPLFSTNPNEIYGYVEKSNLKNFKNPYILWGIDGDFHLQIMESGKKFATTDHCGCLEILDSNISSDYLVLKIDMKKYELGFERTFRPSMDRMKKQIDFEIPIDSSGKFDLTEQNKVVNKYKPFSDFKNRILEIKNEVENQNVTLEYEYEYKEVAMSKLFTVTRGNVFYTKKRILGNNWFGEIPVYSSKTKENGVLTKIQLKHIKNEDLYYKQCLTWATDGYAGTIFIRNADNDKNEKKKQYYFTATDHCGILIPNSSDIYLPFIRFVLEPIFKTKSKGYGKNELKLNKVKEIIVKIPIDSKGNYDMAKQKEIAKLYETIENAKKQLAEQMESIADKHVILN